MNTILRSSYFISYWAFSFLYRSIFKTTFSFFLPDLKVVIKMRIFHFINESVLMKHGLSPPKREVPQWMLYQSSQESEKPLIEFPFNHEYYLWQSPLCVQYFQVQVCAVCSSLLKSVNRGYFYLDPLETWDDQNKIKRTDCFRQHFTWHWHCISNFKTAMEDRWTWRRTVQSLIPTLVK